MAWDLNTVANVSTAGAVLAALVFGIIQVRQAKRKRSETLLMEVVGAHKSEHVSRAIARVLAMPDGFGPGDLDREGEEAVNVVENVFDGIGWMVYRRLCRLRDVDELWGGQVRALWKKVAPLARARRVGTGSASHFEWTQWLAERMERHPSPGKGSGAHVTHAAWRP